MKDPRNVLLEPVMSEKGFHLIQNGVYTFKVHPNSTKPEIAQAVEAVFDVTVVKVNTLRRKGKRIRNNRSRHYGKRPDTKRAMVTLAEGESIELFEV